jgi:hypothetical protein
MTVPTALPDRRMQPTSAAEQPPRGRRGPMTIKERSDCAGAKLIACS